MAEQFRAKREGSCCSCAIPLGSISTFFFFFEKGEVPLKNSPNPSLPAGQLAARLHSVKQSRHAAVDGRVAEVLAFKRLEAAPSSWASFILRYTWRKPTAVQQWIPMYSRPTVCWNKRGWAYNGMHLCSHWQGLVLQRVHYTRKTFYLSHFHSNLITCHQIFSYNIIFLYCNGGLALSGNLWLLRSDFFFFFSCDGGFLWSLLNEWIWVLEQSGCHPDIFFFF